MKQQILLLFCVLVAAPEASTQNTFPASGNVGIGTSSPAQSLTVAGGNIQVATSNLGLIFYGGGEKIIGTVDYGIEFQTSSGTPRMRIYNNGNIQLTTADLGLSFYGGGEKIIGTTDYGIEFQTSSGTPRMKIFNNGAITMGSVPSIPAGYRLFVEQGILTEKVKVAVKTGADWADHVFHKNYPLMPLEQLKNYIGANGHLPGIPSATEVVKEGIDLGKMNAKLLEKIEELTLYVIDLKKENQQQQEAINNLSRRIQQQ